MKRKIQIIGKGNVGVHLQKALSQRKDLEVSLIDSRTLEGVEQDADILLITVSDAAVREVAERIALKLKDFKGLLAHTSGSVELRVLQELFVRCGVFYPLQTFSKDIEIENYEDIPLFVEGSDAESEKILQETGSGTFNSIYTLSSGERKILHLASVFACNFVNAMYGISASVLTERGIPFEVLRPLIRQTASKIETHLPSECQTGPAVRGDKGVMKAHLDLLKDKLMEKTLYQILSEYITLNYGKNR